MTEKTFKVVRWVNHDNKDYFPGDSLIATPEAVQEAVKVGAIYEDPNAALPLIITPPQVISSSGSTEFIPPELIQARVPVQPVVVPSEVTPVVTTAPATATKKEK